ncbi:MAG: lytic transglycosylase domain-containing protein, partial [Terriglobia bacterium]
SPKKLLSPIVHRLTVMAAMATTLSLAAGAARAEIISVKGSDGRPLFINTDDEELAMAVKRGGASAAERLIERRKRSLPDIEPHIKKEAADHDLDPRLVRAMIQVESAWNPQAVSRKGALGLMQLMPDTARRYGIRAPLDAKENVSGGVRHLRYLLDRFGGNLRLALAAYNAGATTVETYGGIPPYRETRQYLERINALYGELGGDAPRHGSIYQLVDEKTGRVI